jgi:O-antigen/teichoic acid export membrane protein
VPLYAKMFSVEEFGMIDVIDVFVFFLLLLTSFEIPTALGRYFMKVKMVIIRKR